MKSKPKGLKELKFKIFNNEWKFFLLDITKLFVREIIKSVIEYFN